MRLIGSYMRPFAGRAAAGVSAKLAGAVVELFIPYILAYLIDRVTPRGDIGQVLLWGGMMLLCSALAWVLNIVANRMAAAVARDSVRALRHDLFAKIMYLSNRQVDALTIPSLISRMTTDTYNVHRAIGMMQRIGIRAPILLLGGLMLTLSLDPVLAGVLAAIMPVLALLVYMISKKSLPMFSGIQRAMDDLIRVVRENTTGIRVIKALSKEDYERARFEGVNSRVVGAETRANVTMGLSRPLMNLLLNFGQVAVIVVGGYRVFAGKAEVGVIVAFLSYFIIMLTAIMAVNRVLLMLQNALASAGRIAEVLQAQSELATLDIPRRARAHHLEMRGVSFSYTGKGRALEDISFALERGESLGVIGPTGAGKSTLAGLLMRFYDVSDGAVLVDGVDVRALSLPDLRGRFGVVFQNDAVFRGPIGQNITLGRALSVAAIDRAVRTARAEGFVAAAGGLAHHVDAHGANLSGGQRQRLLIARALAGEPDILILDDSSSALDYRTDADLRQGLREAYRETTCVIVAQRISSIRHCDKILVLEDGRALGYGSHESLMASCRLYQEIYEIQMGESAGSRAAAGEKVGERGCRLPDK